MDFWDPGLNMVNMQVWNNPGRSPGQQNKLTPREWMYKVMYKVI